MLEFVEHIRRKFGGTPLPEQVSLPENPGVIPFDKISTIHYSPDGQIFVSKNNDNVVIQFNNVPRIITNTGNEISLLPLNFACRPTNYTIRDALQNALSKFKMAFVANKSPMDLVSSNTKRENQIPISFAPSKLNNMDIEIMSTITFREKIKIINIMSGKKVIEIYNAAPSSSITLTATTIPPNLSRV